MKRKRENIRAEDDHGGTCPETSSSNTTSSLNNNNDTNNNNKEQDRFLPIANVGRIMKKVIPGNGKISKEAKETVQECVSEFISFVTGEASDKCQREKRKTINGDDILWAIITLGFEAYVDPLKIYLTKYRDMEGQKLNAPKQQQIDQQQNHQTLGFGGSGAGGVYSSSSVSHPSSFMANDHHLFPLPFSQPSPLPKPDTDEHWR